MIFTEANRKGYTGEFLVIADLTERGFITLTPTNPSTVYDLVVEVENGIYKSIQIKSAYEKNGKILINNRKGANANKRHYTSGDYDILAIVNLTQRKVAYIPFDQCNKCDMTFYAFRPEKIIKTTRLFDDYLEFPTSSEVDNRSTTAKGA